jgi:hypothetical protein
MSEANPSAAPIAVESMSAEQAESFCRRLAQPTIFALTQLIEARRRVDDAVMLSHSAECEIVSALDSARSAVEHATRLIAEIYAGLRAAESPAGRELSQIVDAVVELLEPAFHGRATLRRDYRPTPPVPASRVVLARVFTTFLLDALNDVCAEQAVFHDVRIAVGHDEADDVFVELVRAGPDASRELAPFGSASRERLEPWARVVRAHGGEISVEHAEQGAARMCLRCPSSKPERPIETPTQPPPLSWSPDADGRPRRR